MSILKDSGMRQEFDTGAVRDVTEGKGRCDLLPLDVISELLKREYAYVDILSLIDSFMATMDEEYLYKAILKFGKIRYRNTPDMVLELAIHFEDGCKKYGERNWEKGMPIKRYMDSGIRHYLKWLRGDEDEPHDRAFVWNMVCAIWTLKHKGEDNDKTV